MTESWNPRVHSFAAVWCGAFVAALTLGGGCTEPRFVLEEIGDGGVGVVDAGGNDDRDVCQGDECDTVTVQDPIFAFGFQKWAQSLPGLYAMRAHSYSLGANNEQQSHQLIALAEFVTEDKKPLLKIREVCERKTSSARGGVITTRTVAAPQTLVTRVYAVSFDNVAMTWSAQMPSSAAIGYVPDACSSRTTKGPAQPWRMSPTCMCPSDLTRLPTSPDDCRVSDADGDDTAGLQVTVSGPELEAVGHVVVRDASSFTNGTLGENRVQSAFLKLDEELSTTECVGRDGRGCEMQSRPCPALLNPVEFVPAPGKTPVELAGFTCGAILSQMESLFSKARPQFPENCRP